MYQFKPNGICPTQIQYEIVDGRLQNVQFRGGCPGNLQALSRLVEGLPVNEVIEKLRGIRCRNGTSCADQLACALQQSIEVSCGS